MSVEEVLDIYKKIASVTELKTKKEMKMKLYTYARLIDYIDNYYVTRTEEGSSKRDWIDDNWKSILYNLGEEFERMVKHCEDE